MKNLLTKACVWVQMWRDESGQDLIEYALVVALIAFAAMVGMNSVATSISTIFSSIASKVGAVTIT